MQKKVEVPTSEKIKQLKETLETVDTKIEELQIRRKIIIDYIQQLKKELEVERIYD